MVISFYIEAERAKRVQSRTREFTALWNKNPILLTKIETIPDQGSIVYIEKLCL